MAELIKRTWKSGPRKVRKVAWGYTLQVDGKQERHFSSAGTQDDAEKALAARILGKMTMRYAHLSPAHRRSAVARLDGLTTVDSVVDNQAQDLAHAQHMG